MPLTGNINMQQILPDPIMSNIAMGRMGSGEFIADSIAPVIGTDVDFGRYSIYGSDALEIVNSTKRAPGTSAAMGSMSRTFDTYTCSEDAHKVALNEEDFQGNNPQSVRDQAIDVNVMKIKIAIEARLQAIVAAIPNTMNVPTKWDQSNPSMILNWLNAREAFRFLYGVYPNTAIITPTISHIMEESPEILDYVKFTHPDLLSDSPLPPSIRDVDIVIPTANVKSAASSALTDIWDTGEKSVTFLYVQKGLKYDIAKNRSSATPMMVNTFFAQIRADNTGGLTVATRHWVDPDQSKKSEVISCDMKQTEKVMNGKLGMRFQVLT